MAAKKKTEVVEEVQATEVVEEKPKTKKTSTKKTVKEEVVEEPAVEEPVAIEETTAEVEVVGTKVAEVKEAPKEEPKKEVKKEAKKEVKESQSFLVEVIGNSGVYSFKGPGFDYARTKVFNKGAKLTVVEVKGNWAKITEGNWILLSGSVAKI